MNRVEGLLRPSLPPPLKTPALAIVYLVMLRITTVDSIHAAVKYFEGHLRSGDYYTNDSDPPGEWGGLLARELGLVGHVTDEAWINLCNNRTPDGDHPLTVATRRDRRIGWDFTFNCPKSVSLAAALSPWGEEIRRAFRDSVDRTLADIERDAATRVRVRGQDSDRPTGNLLWAKFEHDVTRPEQGIPDPHLHAHAVVINATRDAVETRIKAVQLGAIKGDGRYYEAVFHSRLASNLAKQGFGIERRGDWWELSGYSRQTIEAFSRRRERILKLAAERGITDPERRTKLAVKTRESKRESLPRSEVEAKWRDIAKGLAIPTEKQPREPSPFMHPDRAVAHALSTHLERSSVARVNEVLESALRHSYGSATPEELARSLAQREDVLRGQVEGVSMVTTHHVLQEERAMIDEARRGLGQCRPIAPDHTIKDDRLSSEQRAALHHVLESKDRVLAITGIAGTGKTALMQEAVGAIEAAGRRVVVLAPTADASRGELRDRGFPDADTLSKFFTSQSLRDQVKGGVIWLDEAGQVGTKGMKNIVEAAKDLNARLVLSGDRRQHAPVVRGDALRTLETEAGIVPVGIETIRRQDDPEHRKAVLWAARGEPIKAFGILDQRGAIREIEDEKARAVELGKLYTNALDARKSVVVVAPTHQQVEWGNAAIRSALRERGEIATEDRTFERLKRIDLTDSERREPERYEAGQVVQFMKGGGGMRAGTRGVVLETEGGGTIKVATERGVRTVPLSMAERFQVYQREEIKIAIGDRLRMTQGVRLPCGEQINSGREFTVAALSPKGEVILDNGQRLPPSFGHWNHGYVVTSHASQGKSVDQAIIIEPKSSFGAANQRQFYVSISRSREMPVVLTDDKAALRAAVTRNESRLSATELARHAAALTQQQRLGLQRVQHEEHTRMVNTILSTPPAVRKLVMERAMIDRVRERGRSRA